jgi:hypothetical protein
MTSCSVSMPAMTHPGEHGASRRESFVCAAKKKKDSPTENYPVVH